MDSSKKLYRDMDNRMVAGVCSGLAEYLNMDVTLVRIGTAVLTAITGGTLILAYIIAAIVVPVKPNSGKK